MQYRHPYMVDNHFRTVMYTPYGYASVPFTAEPNFVRFANPSGSSSYDNYGSPGRALVFSPYFAGEQLKILLSKNVILY